MADSKKIIDFLIFFLLKPINKAYVCIYILENNMDKIKFSTQKDADFNKELRQKINEYFEKNGISKYANTNLIIKTVVLLALYLIPLVFMMTGVVSGFAGILIMWVLMGFGIAGIGMGIMHDANHGSYSKSKTVNNIMGSSLYILGGFPPNWRQQHNRMHHGYTNVYGMDEDIDPGNIMRFSPHSPYKKYHRFQHIYAWFLYSLMTLSWVISKDIEQLSDYRKQNIKMAGNTSYTQLYVKMIAGKLIYYGVFLVLPIILLPIAWYWTVLFFVISHLISGFILGVIFQTAHVMPSSDYPLPNEDGEIDRNFAVHQLMTTADYAQKNPVLTWYSGGLNFQTEHHLFPRISHVHYPKLARIVKELTDKYNIPYHVNKSFWSALVKHGQMMKMLGQNPDK